MLKSPKDGHCQSLPFLSLAQDSGDSSASGPLLLPDCRQSHFQMSVVPHDIHWPALSSWVECAVRVSQDKGMLPELNFSVSNSTLDKACNFRVWF